MVKRGAALLLAVTVLLLIPSAYADLPWLQETGGQRQLKSYIENVNAFLTEAGMQPVNSLFEEYASFAVLGITASAQAETPEGTEITVKLFSDTMNSLELRMNRTDLFPEVAGAFIKALSEDEGSTETALLTVLEKARRASENPEQSFEDEVEELNGTKPYIYCAYYPDQFSDGVSWIQMTVIFPMNGMLEWEEVGSYSETTKAPDTYSDRNEDYEGYYFSDGYNHYDVYATPTPEPDSPAGNGYFVP